MDPFSSEGELLTLHNAFYQGQFQMVISHDVSNLSPENVLAARMFKLRARIATGDAAKVSAELDGQSTPDLVAVKALADYVAGRTAAAEKQLQAVVASAKENATVQVVGATLLQLLGRSEEAVALLGAHQGNLEAVALIVQIRLAQNRTDLAMKEVQAAKRWAQDSLLVNLAEAWVGLRVGGEKYYNQSYYVFEELAQAPSTSSAAMLVGQAATEIHLARLEEAEVALQQALEKEPGNGDARANEIVLAVLAGREPEEKIRELRNTAAGHPFLVDMDEKSELFDKAAAKYAEKVGA